MKNINTYILFYNYEQGLLLYDLLIKEGVRARIAPTPYQIQGELSCGMSLLIKNSDLKRIKEIISRYKCKYYDIVTLEGQINPNRDKFC